MKNCNNCDHAEVCGRKGFAGVGENCSHWSGWISVQEENPPELVTVMISYKGITSHDYAEYYHKGKEWDWAASYKKYWKWWRPLPKGVEEN